MRTALISPNMLMFDLWYSPPMMNCLALMAVAAGCVADFPTFAFSYRRLFEPLQTTAHVMQTLPYAFQADVVASGFPLYQTLNHPVERCGENSMLRPLLDPYWPKRVKRSLGEAFGLNTISIVCPFTLFLSVV